MSSSEFLTVGEVAELLRVTPKAIYCKLYRGELPNAAIVQRCKRGRLLFVKDILLRHLLRKARRGGQ